MPDLDAADGFAQITASVMNFGHFFYLTDFEITKPRIAGERR
jgi:hypothetical protein